MTGQAILSPGDLDDVVLREQAAAAAMKSEPTAEGVRAIVQSARDVTKLLGHMAALAATPSPQSVAVLVLHSLDCRNPETCDAVAKNIFEYMLVQLIKRGDHRERAHLAAGYPLPVAYVEQALSGLDGRRHVEAVARGQVLR